MEAHHPVKSDKPKGCLVMIAPKEDWKVILKAFHDNA